MDFSRSAHVSRTIFMLFTNTKGHSGYLITRLISLRLGSFKAFEMIVDGFYHLKFILLWIFLFINVFGEEILQTTKIEDKKNFKALKISNNKIVGVLPSDQEIILKHNKTSTFFNLSSLKHLTWINGYLDKAELGLLKKFSDLESLAFIQIKGNIILTEDILANLTELKELVVHQNARVILEKNSLRNLVNLQVFSADNQSLKSLSSDTFQNCGKLQYLSFNNGFLGNIQENAFQHLKNLISITLTKMSLEHLKKNTFNDLPLLYLIDLSGNRLHQVSGAEFHNLPRMEVLNLERNNLHAINAESIIKNMPVLNILEISENKFSCVERLRLNNILSKQNISSFDKRDLDRCHFARGIQIFSA